MADAIRCPNPSCTHRFPAEALRGAAQLVCPRCGKVVQPRKQQASPAPAPAPSPPAVPAKVDKPTNSVLFSLGDVDPLSLRKSTVRKRRPWVSLVLGVVAIALCVWGGVYGYRLLPRFSSTADSPKGSEVLFPQLNCRLIVPDGGWSPDLELRQAFRALLAVRRDDPEGWLLLSGREIKGRTMAPDEMREEALDLLSDYFGDSFEWQSDEPVTIAGQTAPCFRFRGETDKERLSGGVAYFTNQGIAYWLYVAEPAEAKVRADSVASRFSLLKEARDEKPTAKADKTFRGRQAKYSLQDDSDTWTEWTPATDYDPQADLALVAKAREGEKDGDRRERVVATVVVLLLPDRIEDPRLALETVQSRLEKNQKVDYPDTTLEAVPDAASRPEAFGAWRSLQVRNGASRQRFVLLGVAERSEGLLVVECECDWKARSTWEKPFHRLLESFRLSGK